MNNIARQNFFFYHLKLISLELGIFLQTWYLTNGSDVTLNIVYITGTESIYVKLGYFWISLQTDTTGTEINDFKLCKVIVPIADH